MTNPVFPITAMAQDSKFYNVTLEDPALKSKMDGGYVVSRAKHTRKPRLSFDTGYTMVKPADRTLLEDFYNLVQGGSVIFDWIDPVSTTVYQVRFSKPISFKYVGVGANKLWDVMISLEQA